MFVCIFFERMAMVVPHTLRVVHEGSPRTIILSFLHETAADRSGLHGCFAYEEGAKNESNGHRDVE